MTNFNGFNKTIEQIQAGMVLTYAPSILKMGFQTQSYNAPLGAKVISTTYELDSLVNGATIETFDNTTAPIVNLNATNFEFNHFGFEAYITAKKTQNVTQSYFDNASNLYINEVLSRSFDKIAFNGYGNEGLFTNAVIDTTLTGITTGKLLVDKIIKLSMDANKFNNRPVNNPVSVLLSGLFSELYAFDFYSDFSTIQSMIPSWIRVELSANDQIISGNSITIASTIDVKVHHGLLPQVLEGYQLITQVGTSGIYQVKIGCSSVAVEKMNGKKVYVYKQA